MPLQVFIPVMIKKIGNFRVGFCNLLVTTWFDGCEFVEICCADCDTANPISLSFTILLPHFHKFGIAKKEEKTLQHAT